eukprot:249121-Chlamydomonas_euryale.AAC.11
MQQTAYEKRRKPGMKGGGGALGRQTAPGAAHGACRERPWEGSKEQRMAHAGRDHGKAARSSAWRMQGEAMGRQQGAAHGACRQRPWEGNKEQRMAHTGRGHGKAAKSSTWRMQAETMGRQQGAAHGACRERPRGGRRWLAKGSDNSEPTGTTASQEIGSVKRTDNSKPAAVATSFHALPPV